MVKQCNGFNKIVSLLLSGVIFFCVPSIFCGCFADNRYDGELLRLHIRANSNDKLDQDVKLKVRDAVNKYVSENVAKATFEEAYEDIGYKLDSIVGIATDVLRSNGFAYDAQAKLSNEYFPSRKYGSTVVPEGFYDALVVELGEAQGDNWWCVIYPPLCYGEDFEYKSLFGELFSK